MSGLTSQGGGGSPTPPAAGGSIRRWCVMLMRGTCTTDSGGSVSAFNVTELHCVPFWAPDIVPGQQGEAYDMWWYRLSQGMNVSGANPGSRNWFFAPYDADQWAGTDRGWWIESEDEPTVADMNAYLGNSGSASDKLAFVNVLEQKTKPSTTSKSSLFGWLRRR